MEWISVEKEWPNREEGEKILAWNGYAFECECDQDGDWCSLGGDEFTHWMPLPEPPKESEDE